MTSMVEHVMQTLRRPFPRTRSTEEYFLETEIQSEGRGLWEGRWLYSPQPRPLCAIPALTRIYFSSSSTLQSHPSTFVSILHGISVIVMSTLRGNPVPWISIEWSRGRTRKDEEANQTQTRTR